MRYVADMRRCQYVVQRPEGVRRRQRLNVEYVDRRADDLLVFQHADQSFLFDDRPARRIDQPGRWLHSLQFRSPYQAARTAAQHQMDRQDVRPLEQLVLGNQDCARGFGALGRHVLAPGIRFIPKTLPTRATCDPIRPSPSTPRVFPRRSVPTVCCQPPDRTELLSVTICRAEAKISAQVNSIVGSDRYAV